MSRVLKIDRAKWRHGGKSALKLETMMLNPENQMMCCLGFDCHQAGVPKRDLEDLGDPQDVHIDSRHPRIPQYLLARSEKNAFDDNSDFAIEAISINDMPEISNEKREELLIAHYATINRKVEFYGEYPA